MIPVYRDYKVEDYRSKQSLCLLGKIEENSLSINVKPTLQSNLNDSPSATDTTTGTRTVV